MANQRWREREVAWFLQQLIACYDVIPMVRVGERGVFLEEWHEATGLERDNFDRLFSAAWEDNLIYRRDIEDHWDGGWIPAYTTYGVTGDGHRFLGFIERETLPTRSFKQPIPNDLRWAVWERDNFTCRHCGARRDLSVDHIVPESRGGAMALDNLQTLCRSCNSRKGARP